MKYIRKIYVKEIETEDCISVCNIDKILGYNEEGHDFETLVKDDNNSSWGGEVAAMPIVEIEDILFRLKKERNCTHVEIMYHEDHGGYIFNGVVLRKATDDEIEKHVNKKEEIDDAAKTVKIALLEQELKELKG